MKKRLIGILLTVMIIAGIMALFAVSASAADDWGVCNLDSDVSGVQFIKDGNHTDKHLRINLNGHTWTLTEEVDTYNLGIKCLRIENGTIKTEGMEGKYGFEIWGGLELENVNCVNCSCINLFYISSVYYGNQVCRAKNCNFKDGTFTGNGGVFYLNFTDGFFYPEFHHCNFINCKTTKSGGALYFNNVGSATCPYVYITGCNFLKCHADGDGGAIYINDRLNLDRNNWYNERCFFVECTAGDSGGAIYDDDGYGLISECNFYGCSAQSTYGGGAVLLDSPERRIYNCDFYGCNAPNGKGSAIWCESKDCAITGCNFEGNGIIPGASLGVKQRSTYYSYYENSLTNCFFSNPFNVEGAMESSSINYRYFYDPYTFGEENYSGNTLIRGNSPENPIIIRTYEDFKALALNIMELDETDHWSDKYYSLETDIYDWYIRFEVKDGHLAGNKHRITTRLADSFATGDGYATGLVEDGVFGYSRISGDLKFANQDGKTVKLADYPGNHYFLNKNMTRLGDGWYIVDSDVTYDDNVRLEVAGTVNIILLDACTLTVKRGIHINNDSRLNIYSEHIDTSDNNNMGTIHIDAPDIGGEYNSSDCGIGTNVKGGEKNVVLSIFGGNIDVNSRGRAPAIGVAGDEYDFLEYPLIMSGYFGWATPVPMVFQSMDINIHNGVVNATTLAKVPAIGSHTSYGTMTINISGGKIKAKNGNNWCEIGRDDASDYAANITGGDFYFVESATNLHIDSYKLNMTGGTIHTEEHTEHVWVNGVCQICRVECAHDWNEGVCNICQHHCPHNWQGGECKDCKAICTHEWFEGECTICNVRCVHEWDGGVCKTCKFECIHEWNESVCNICHYHCQHHWQDGECSDCKVKCSHDWKDGVCQICSIPCVHEWDDGVCTVCLYECHHNGDTCALCGKTIVSEDGNFLAAVLSEGSLVIICSVACLAVGFLASMFVFKKKKPEAADGEQKKDKEE